MTDARCYGLVGFIELCCACEGVGEFRFFDVFPNFCYIAARRSCAEGAEER